MRAHRALLPALAAAALLLGACSSDGSDGATTTTVPRSTTTAGGDDTGTTAPDRSTTTEADDATTTTATEREPVDADGQAYVDALEAAIGESESTAVFEPAQARCLAEGFVSGVGVDELQRQGVTPEEFAMFGGITGSFDLELDEATASDLFDVYGDCDVDLVELFTATGEADLTAEQRSCIEGFFTDENLRRSFVASVTGQDLEDDPLLGAVSCVDLGAP